MTVADLPAYFAREAAVYRLAEMTQANRRSPAVISYVKHRAAALKGRGK